MGLAVLAVIPTYYRKVRFPIPGGLLAVLVGSVGLSSGLTDTDPQRWSLATAQIGWRWPQLALGSLWAARGELLPWLGVIVPMGLFNVLGSLQNIESAEAAKIVTPCAAP